VITDKGYCFCNDCIPYMHIAYREDGVGSVTVSVCCSDGVGGVAVSVV